MLLLEQIHTDGVEVFPRVACVTSRRRGTPRLRRAVVSSSANTRDVLARSPAWTEFFEVRVDGVVGRPAGPAGKPAPDTYLAAARLLGVQPAQAAVFEDALAGVEAGRAGGFGSVVGVDRVDQAADLAAHGATRVVDDLAELLEPQ